MPFVPDKQTTGRFVPDATPATTTDATPAPTLESRLRSALGLGDIPPDRLAAIDASRARPWGSGIEPNAYKLGQSATDAATKIGLPPEVAGGVGYAANVAGQAIPTLFGGSMVGKAISPAIESGARSLMRSALKPGTKAVKTGDAAKAITTMLNEGISPTTGGLEKLRGLIGQVNDEIAGAIANSPATVDKGAVASRLYDTLGKFEKQVNSASDTAAIRKAWDEFLAHPLLAGSSRIPVQLAQDMKRGTYQQVRKKYGQLGSADVEAQKALARGLKEEIASTVPEVGAANARESDLLKALKLVEHRAAVEGNKNPMGLALLAEGKLPGAAFLADRSGALKGLLARGLYSGRQAVPETAARGILATILAAQANAERNK